MSLPENAIKFKEIEKEIQQKCYALGRETLKGILSELDTQLMRGRDKRNYRHAGRKATTLKTVFGEVSYERTHYETTDSTGRKKYVFLLDEVMDFDGTGHFSSLLTELIV